MRSGLPDEFRSELCVQACPVDCIHPKQDEASFAEVPQLYVSPDECIDCGACVPVCPTNSDRNCASRLARWTASTRSRMRPVLPKCRSSTSVRTSASTVGHAFRFARRIPIGIVRPGLPGGLHPPEAG